MWLKSMKKQGEMWIMGLASQECSFSSWHINTWQVVASKGHCSSEAEATTKQRFNYIKAHWPNFVHSVEFIFNPHLIL